ncbi:MAG: hypothetical protein FJZ59_06290 [Chlamydiae bacterium]|jgi:hypothetical protein|nr:hypothetical protein [Chlamydiota bacterium]
MQTKEKSNTFFHKKVYASIYKPSNLDAEKKQTLKKIIPSTKIGGLREDFKKIFLPLLIDIFELRQQVQNYKQGLKTPFRANDKPSCPKEILARLTELQEGIGESRRWCEGVILQIAKGIDDAKEALQFIEKMGDKIESKEQKPTLIKRLYKFFSRTQK